MVLGVGRELGERVDRQLGADDDDVWNHGEQPDRREVLLRVVTKIVEQRTVRRQWARRAHQQRISVRLGLRGRGGANIAAGAGAIVDDKAPPHGDTHALEHDAGEHVARAAACERNDDLDGARRVAFRTGRHGAGEQRKRKRRRAYSLARPHHDPRNFAGRLAWNASTPSRKSSDCRSRL